MPFQSSLDLLPNTSIARFARVRFPVHRPVTGTRSGDHRSPHTGSSTEFAQHREYSPGDEPKSIDWRAFGKTDRYYVKQYSDDTNLRAFILLDCSASMGYSDQESRDHHRSAFSKLDYARRLAAMIAWILVRQGDAVSLIVFDDQIRLNLPMLSTTAHLHQILRTLSEVQAQRSSNCTAVMHEVAGQISNRGLVIVISDFLDELTQFSGALHHLRHHNHEIIVFQTLASDELSFPFRHTARFRDLEELIEEQHIDPAAIRQEYLRQINSHLSELQMACNLAEADFARFTTDLPLDDALADYFALRMMG
ncbi:MAG: DUF58 domain-containing protein [Planctomyces sp.]|nr:DUF58 domain-containing protein [Planctomyces sp.]